ncbi:MAG: hypothetical protein ACOCY8_00125 [Spirochaetota bacterium]
MLVPPPGGFVPEPERESQEPSLEVDRENVEEGARKLFDFLQNAFEESEESSEE